MHDKTVGMLSLGCAKNLVDSEVMLGELSREGYAFTADASEANIVIVNTCGFIDKAKEESVDAILEMANLKKEGKLDKLIVSGCLSQRYHQELSVDLPEVDLFLGINHVGNIKEFVADLRNDKEVELNWDPEFLYSANNPRIITTASHSAFVKISEGCDHVCSFCIIPSLRGKHRSRTIEDIKREVVDLAGRGIREINLVAQDSTYYGRDLGMKEGLAQLLETLAGVDGIAWIRIHYMYPYQVTNRLLETMSALPKVCSYLDMPLQHSSQKVLAAMKRGSGRPQLEKFLSRIRNGLPNANLRSSFIVGFPGETEVDFADLCDFIKTIQFDYIGIFTYSQEEGTTAYPLGEGVPEEMKEERKACLLELQRDISREKLVGNIGKTFDVLIEGIHPETELLLRGRHQGQASEVDGEVLITEGTYQLGDIIPVTIEETFDYDMAGRVIGGIEV